MTVDHKKEYQLGLKRGIPIAIGYLPVSFTFGLAAVKGGMPVWLAVLTSLTNLTSAGQFAGINLIFDNAGFIEIILTTLVINLRYMLMSLSLSQKLADGISIPKRCIFAFGVTDETFSMASMEHGRLSFLYMTGLITGPIIGWSTGTALGALICHALPERLSSAMGIALYGMFIAIIIPPARKSKPVVAAIVISVGITCLLRYVPLFSFISFGFRVIISTLISAGICAWLFPAKEENV